MKENMVEIEGEITKLEFDERWPFTEAAWVHKANGKYYLTYACTWPEKIAYAMADSIHGPWEYRGRIRSWNLTERHISSPIMELFLKEQATAVRYV